MMKRVLLRSLFALVVLHAQGCSSSGTSSSGWLGGGDGSIAIAFPENEGRKANPNAPQLKYAASIRIGRYEDARKTGNPRLIGTGADRVSGMSGKDILLNQDAATALAAAMKARLDDAGFQVSETPGTPALFELGGVVKELTLNVKDRDEISIVVETTLKEAGTGNIVWSGVVVEKNDRFAGVSGNSKNDVARYLRKGLDTVTGKTVEAISASLMAARPELFNLTPGTKPIPGVTVLVAPPAGAPMPQPVAAPAPAMQPSSLPAARPAAPAAAYPPIGNKSNGMLMVSTLPGRAKVYLDGVYYGLSPLQLEIEPGIHAVSVKLEGYRMVTEKVSVRRGEHTEMDLTLER